MAPMITIEETVDSDGFIEVPLSVNIPTDVITSPRDKASRILGIRHRSSMEPIPASRRTSIISNRSVRDPPVPTAPALPLASLYVVSGLPKSPHTWTLADPDSVLGLTHTEGAVNRWWRPEVLGSTVTPGSAQSGSSTASLSGKKKRNRRDDPAGALSKQEVGKMLSKALKLSFTREVEVIASTLQPASTVHTFTFTLGSSNTSQHQDFLRTPDHHRLTAFSLNSYDDPLSVPQPTAATTAPVDSTLTYHGVCLTVWSHADQERSAAIRRTLESRPRKESAQSFTTSRIKALRNDISTKDDPTILARRATKKGARGPWTDGETDGAETENDAVSESDAASLYTVTNGHGPGESSLFLPADSTVFWLPYALTLVSRHPVYDLMRDFLTLSWARFSKDVQSHTLQINKILSHPAPRASELIRLDASPRSESLDNALEVIARFPGYLDFGRGLVDINFTMWPLFKALNVDNILTICEIALSPTGKILFISRHPAMLGIAVSTIKYLVELRGWNGIALPAVNTRDAKIYIEDMGPWILGLATEARYCVRPSADVCVVDLDINYLSCPSPPPGVVSTKQQREKYRQRLLGAFESHYHPDHSVPSEFKEAFPAGRFRPICKVQAKRGAQTSIVAEQIKPPDWWNSTRIIQAFDSVLQDRYKKPSILKRISLFGGVKRPPRLTAAEQTIQLSIRKRATAFVDARDDLETKIGRLSRRLNFLMTESDLWRDKFVTFEQYAEKLSVEANQLRTKINKEQKETKRLSGIVLMTAAEKTKLQNQLKDTESAHKEAMGELEKMRETMEKMEQERAEMVAEIESQIEKALASMTIGIDDSDYGSSRPSSRLSSASVPHSRSRRASDASKARHMRSFGTESTLAESFEETGEDTSTVNNPSIEEVIEEEEHDGLSPRKKRFSVPTVDMTQDGMNAVDEGITEKSERIAQKVLEIQHKLETALASDRRVTQWKNQTSAAVADSEEEYSEATHTRPRPRRARGHKPARTRSGTVSSTQTTTPPARASEEGMGTPVRRPIALHPDGVTDPGRDEESTPEPKPKSIPKTGRHHPGLLLSPTDDLEESDTDFQSAYSAEAFDDND